MGSPKTHAWMWKFYTPRMQILEFFPYTDEGWRKANEVEDRLIMPDLNNPLCLNEGCNLFCSIEAAKKGGQTAGKITGKQAVENGVGIFSPDYRNSERYAEDRKNGGSNGGPKAGRVSHEKKVGCHSEEYKSSPKYKKDRIRNAEITNSQVWESTVDGFRSSSGNVAKHNRANGWDPQARIRVS